MQNICARGLERTILQANKMLHQGMVAGRKEGMDETMKSGVWVVNKVFTGNQAPGFQINLGKKFHLVQ